MGGCVQSDEHLEYRSAVLHGVDHTPSSSLFGSNLNLKDSRKVIDRRFGQVRVVSGGQTQQDLAIINLTYKNANAGQIVQQHVTTRTGINHSNLQRPLECKSAVESSWCVSQLQYQILTELPNTDVGLLMQVSSANASGFSDETLLQLWEDSIRGMQELEVRRLCHGHLSPKMIGWFKGEECFKIVEVPWFDPSSVNMSDLDREDLYLSPKVFRDLASRTHPTGDTSSSDRVYFKSTNLSILDDVFSLGLILLYCATGIQADTFYDGFTQRLNEQKLMNCIQKMETLRVNLPQFVVSTKMMLAMDESQRPTFARIAREFGLNGQSGRNSRRHKEPEQTQSWIQNKGNGNADQSGATVWLRQWDRQSVGSNERPASTSVGKMGVRGQSEEIYNHQDGGRRSVISSNSGIGRPTNNYNIEPQFYDNKTATNPGISRAPGVLSLRSNQVTAPQPPSTMFNGYQAASNLVNPYLNH